jgi:L-lactate permease
VTSFNALGKAIYKTLVEVDVYLATVTDQVVMVLAWLYRLIPLFTVTKFDRLNQAQSEQGIERPVNRGQSGRVWFI